MLDSFTDAKEREPGISIFLLVQLGMPDDFRYGQFLLADEIEMFLFVWFVSDIVHDVACRTGIEFLDNLTDFEGLAYRAALRSGDKDVPRSLSRSTTLRMRWV